MNAMNEEDQDIIALAQRCLGEYPRPWPEPARPYNPEREKHLKPQTLLQAAFDYAPPAGRLNIAKEIVAANDNAQSKAFNSRMEELSDHIYYNLLMPRPSPNSVVVPDRSQGFGWPDSKCADQPFAVWF